MRGDTSAIAFTKWKCATEVQGNATAAGSLFPKTFHEYIDWIDKKNQIDSFFDDEVVFY